MCISNTLIYYLQDWVPIVRTTPMLMQVMPGSETRNVEHKCDTAPKSN